MEQNGCNLTLTQKPQLRAHFSLLGTCCQLTLNRVKPFKFSFSSFFRINHGNLKCEKPNQEVSLKLSLKSFSLSLQMLNEKCKKSNQHNRLKVIRKEKFCAA